MEDQVQYCSGNWKNMNYYALLGMHGKKHGAVDWGTLLKDQKQKLEGLLPPKTFARINKAYRVLSNPMTKQVYDKQVENNGGLHPSNFRMF